MGELESSLRLLGAAEFAASELSTSNARSPVVVKKLHWDWACQYTMCAFGERPRCLDRDSKLRLWHVTVFPGYMEKLARLGFEDPKELGRNFHEATAALAKYLRRYRAGRLVVESGALRLQSNTWRERLRLLGIEVADDEIDLPAPETLSIDDIRQGLWQEREQISNDVRIVEAEGASRGNQRFSESQIQVVEKIDAAVEAIDNLELGKRRGRRPGWIDEIREASES